LRGYVVICPDGSPFESRSLANSSFKETFSSFQVFTHYDGNELNLTEDLYRGCIANRLLFEGRNLIGKEIFEMKRALDCLSNYPVTDADRIGVIGHSAGDCLQPW